MRDILDLIGIVVSLYVALRCVELCFRLENTTAQAFLLGIPAMVLMLISLGAAAMLGLDMISQHSAVP